MAYKVVVNPIQEVELLPSDFGTCETKVVEMGNVIGVTYFKVSPHVNNSLFFTEYSPKVDENGVAETYGGYYDDVLVREEKRVPLIQKLSATQYLDRRTNEVKDYKKSENRAENVKSLKRTFARLRALINANVTAPENMRWVTLTYAENMTDRDRLYHDYEKFWKRFLYYCKTHDIGKPEYIAVAEPQGRGAWHMHVLMIWDGPAPYLHNDTVFYPLWGHGHTKIKAVRKNCDNVGAYFSAYLADMPVDDMDKMTPDEKNKALTHGLEIVEKTVTENGKKTRKAIVKGGRLHMYPSGMNLYRASRGLKKPQAEWMDSTDAKRKVQGATCTFRRGYEIKLVDDESGKEGVANIIIKEYYNVKCSDCQAVSDSSDDFLQDIVISGDIVRLLLQPSGMGNGAP